MLYFMTDNGIYSVAYLCKGGIIPDWYALQSESIKNVLPYFSTDDELIVLTQGMIEWNLIRLSKLVDEIENCKQNLKSVRIFSTIELPLKCDYTLVKGDLFNGEYVDYTDRKWGKPYQANIKELYSSHNTETELLSFDEDEEEDEEIVVRHEVPLHLVEVDITKVKERGNNK